MTRPFQTRIQSNTDQILLSLWRTWLAALQGLPDAHAIVKPTLPSSKFDIVKHICRFVSLNKTRGLSYRSLSPKHVCFPALAAVRLPCARALDTKGFTSQVCAGVQEVA
jgi:hypothetical protein